MAVKHGQRLLRGLLLRTFVIESPDPIPRTLKANIETTHSPQVDAASISDADPVAPHAEQFVLTEEDCRTAVVTR